MNIFLFVSSILLWLLVLFLGFLLLGALRVLGLLKWRLEQLEATTPSRLGRSGLKVGKKAPDFTLSSVAGPEVALHDFAGRKVLLVLTQSGCGPCKDIVPELNRVDGHDLQVLVVNKGDLQTTRKWCYELDVHFPVLVRDGLELARKYEVFATPFAFLIDENGVIVSKGISSSKQHIGYMVSDARGHARARHVRSAHCGTESLESKESDLHFSPSKKVDHV
jgi:methylamine dehydrogenase accessory protein MauD